MGLNKNKKTGFDNKKINKILDILDCTYPNAECALDYGSVFQLLIAVTLSAQTTDKSVNIVTKKLFERYANAKQLSEANAQEVEGIIKQIGMYKTKTKNIIEISKKIAGMFNGEIPGEYEELVKLPGVGRKTANVVLSVGFGEQRIAVDTHVFRVANRIGIAKGKDVLSTELSLMENIPRERWTQTHHGLIFHGRNCCKARNPNCKECPLNEDCLSSPL
ncbi:MAG: endonuclease III [Peptostreptococcaceae bacterium]|nr:endonuclease III [Peptostreptococcaceae bacterium]